MAQLMSIRIVMKKNWYRPTSIQGQEVGLECLTTLRRNKIFEWMYGRWPASL